MTKLTNATKGRTQRLSLVASLALAALGTSPLARAGHFTVDDPVWIAPYTTSGDATAGISGPTVSWETSASANSPYGPELDSGVVMGTVRWRIVWHSDAPSDVPPTSAVVRIARTGHVYASTTARGRGETGLVEALASAIDSGILDGANAGSTVLLADDEEGRDDTTEGELTNSHHGYYTFDGSTLDSQEPTVSTIDGERVATVEVDVNSASYASANGGIELVGSRFDPHADALADSSTAGSYRLITVGSDQVNDDFPGGSFPPNPPALALTSTEVGELRRPTSALSAFSLPTSIIGSVERCGRN